MSIKDIAEQARRILEEGYPARVHELAERTGWQEEKVAQALEYVCRETKDSKYVLLEKLLMFHRTLENQKMIDVRESSGITEDYTAYVQPRHGIIAHRFISSRRWLVVVIKQPYNYKLAVSKDSPKFYDNVWCYAQRDDALESLASWDPATMEGPLGWIRNPTTGRRREYDASGNIIREWIAR